MNHPNAIFGSGGRGQRWRAVVFRLAAVLLGLLPFILAEAGLRLFGVGRPEESADALSGFNPKLPLFIRQGPVYRTTRAREPFFNPQQFTATKPNNGFRAFCFGGSTVYGHPYKQDTAFPKWLELELSALAPGRPHEVINCGGVSYASYRLVPLVREVLHYQPDLVIVATGHNEFLEDRTYQSIKSRSAVRTRLENAAQSLRLFNLARRWTGKGMPAPRQELSPEVQPKLDQASGYASYHRDDAWHERVIAQYDESVRIMIADCRAAGVPVILVKLGSNLRDCPPFKSEHRAGLSAEQERSWEDAFDGGSAAESKDASAALSAYRKAEDIDSQYALLSYRIARIHDRLGQKAEALQYYIRAKDQDICPLRIITPFQEILTRVAADLGVPLLDADALIAAQVPAAIPGFDWYLDHVHPNIGGHQRIAQALAEQVRRLGLAPATPPWGPEKRRQTFARHIQQLSLGYFADGLRRVAWLDAWARRQRLAQEALPLDAPGYARLGFRRLDLGDAPGAREVLAKALQLEPSVTSLIRNRASELESEGRAEAARDLDQNIPQ